MDKSKKGTPVLFPAVSLAGALVLAGALLWVRHARSGMAIRETPFGLEAGTHLDKGKDFRGKADLQALSDPERKSYWESDRLARKGQDAMALKGFQALLAARPGHPLASGQSALLHIRRMSARADSAAPSEDSLQAAGLIREGLAKSPDHPFLHYVRGRFWAAAGRPDSAEAGYRRAITLSPQFAYAYAGLGRLQAEQWNFGPAVLNFRAAIGLMESFPADYLPIEDAEGEARGRSALPEAETVPLDQLAALYYRKGAQDSAWGALEYAQQQGWKSREFDLVQAWLWESQGLLSKADSTYRRLLAQDPGNPAYAEAMNTLGWKPGQSGGAHTGSSDAVFAIYLLDPLVRQYPRNAPLWMALGQAYYRRGLFGMAAESFDSSIKYDPALPGLMEKRELAFRSWMRENARKQNGPPVPGEASAAKPEKPPKGRAELPPEDQTPVIIPGSIALLGTYSVPWGSTPAEVRRAYPRKEFRAQANGNLLDVFMSDGVKHEYLLAFKEGKLWGIRVFVSDSAHVSGDLFGRLIRTKTKISGEGKGTGEAACPGFRPFQGAIWENDDTFEFMAQFNGMEHQVRLARMGREYLPQNRRLCDLVPFLQAEAWEK